MRKLEAISWVDGYVPRSPSDDDDDGNDDDELDWLSEYSLQFQRAKFAGDILTKFH